MNGKQNAAATVGYWQQARRPLVALVYVLPMILIYEAGVLLLGSQATRNGVDVYLRGILDFVGFGQYFLLPALTCGLLLAWHHMSHDRWRFHASVLLLMLIESLVFAFLLLILAQVQHRAFTAIPVAALPATAIHEGNFGHLVGYLGAGIYEELLFRLMLLPATAFVVRQCGVKRTNSLIIAVILTSLVFSAVHYRAFTFNEHAESFEWFSFTFRCLAGVFFAVLFIYRGFGIAVGAHAFYDVLVQWLFS